MKYALIDLNREKGPIFSDTKNILEEEQNNILLFALPRGEAKDGSFKLTTLKDNFYVSHIKINKNNVGKAAVIGINIKEDDMKFNPFRLFQYLQNMIESNSISEINVDNISTEPISSPYSEIEGGEYIMSSLFLLRRVIVVGDHSEIIDFLSSLYEASPVYSIPFLSCVTWVKSISENINIQGVERSEDIYKQLDKARKDSTIVMLDELQAFGTISSPFTKKIADYYRQGDFNKSRELIKKYIKISAENQIDSAADFAAKHDMSKADAKLLKTFQNRVKEVQLNRQKDVYYRGVD